MKKTFIEDLWSEKPELIKNKLSEILDIEQDNLVYDEKAKGGGYLRFGIKSPYIIGYEDEIIVSDYKVRFVQDKLQPPIVDEWVSFMFDNCGNPYALKFISDRNQQLDKFLARLEEKYNNETRQVLNVMGFLDNKGHTK